MILSPKDDFKNRTLRALASLIEKLAYVCSLRNPDGTYDHWGLKQLLGEAKANATIQCRVLSLTLDTKCRCETQSE